MSELRVHIETFPGDPAFDTAVSHALLRAVAAGTAPETLRLYTPGDALAFSVLDRTRPGFARAVACAAERGFAPILRLAGGRAAAFERKGLAFAWTLPARDARAGIRQRFVAASSMLARALVSIGVDARVGEVPGEYCPGEFSVNARGRVKLAGIGQRVLRGAAHVGGVLIVEGAGRVRDVLGPVYAELGHAFSPATVGAVQDELGAERDAIGADAVAAALLAVIARERSLVEAPIDAQLLEAAQPLAAAHRAAPLGSRAEPASVGALPGSNKIVAAPH